MVYHFQWLYSQPDSLIAFPIQRIRFKWRVHILGYIWGKQDIQNPKIIIITGGLTVFSSKPVKKQQKFYSLHKR